MSNKEKLQDNNERLLDITERMLKVAENIGPLHEEIEHYVATEGQTVFPIAYSLFDYRKDVVFVNSGITSLSMGLDFTLESQKVVLKEGVPEGRTITIRILKNVNTEVEEKTMSGVYISPGSIPLDRLAENVVTCDIPMHMSVNEDGGVQIKYTGLLYETIEYIESTGTQYINTGLKPNNNYRVVMDFQLTSADGYTCLFGSADSTSKNENSFALWHNGTTFAYYYGTGTFKNFPNTLVATGEYSTDCNGPIATIDGNTVTHEAVSFTGSQNMYLFAVNYGGTASYFASGKWKPCKIYDENGTLVRDYIPVKTPGGVPCMLDKLTGEFYHNKGTGEFIAGAKL